jgi:CO/xanthine dehydrogenase FAD-binding subunit
MRSFTYTCPENVAAALGLLSESGYRSQVLAGGTDLLVAARHDPGRFDRVVDIGRLAELHAIERLPDGSVQIGAAVTFSEAIASPLIGETAPLLVDACRQVGAPQIRNQGTLGGNVANAAACADSLPALVCLNATVTYQTLAGSETLPVGEFVLAPNHTRLPAGGLLTALTYLPPEPGTRHAFLKLGRRNALAISRLTVAALGRLGADGCVSEVRLVPGAAAPQVMRYGMAEEMLLGTHPSRALCEEAGRAAAEQMITLAGRRWSAEYKEPALAALVARALWMVVGES